MNRRLELGALLCALPYRRGFLNKFCAARSAIVTDADVEAALREEFTALELDAARRRASRDLQAAFAMSRNPLAGVDCWFIWEPTYPASLAAIFDPPAALFVRAIGVSGSPDAASILAQPGLAIVGTRNPHPILPTVMQRLVQSKQTVIRGAPIISGFARGVDRLAHWAAIQSGQPGAAVLGAGVLVPGPQTNLDLLRRAGAGAPLLLLSEFGLTTQGHAGHFPRRNRIIAGLAERIVVAQAPARSGALITADYALEEGRDVMVFDHPVLDTEPGCNDGGRQLLADGAERLSLDIDSVLARYREANKLPGHSPPDGQLRFWRAALGARRELGGGYLVLD